MTRRFWLSLLSILPFARKPLKAGNTLSFNIKGTVPPSLLGYLFLRDDNGTTSIWPLTTHRPYFVAGRPYTVIGFQHADSAILSNYTGNRILRPNDQFLVNNLTFTQRTL